MPLHVVSIPSFAGAIMIEETKQIVLGSGSGTFWKGGQDPWTDNPTKARVFTNPREAWEQATNLQADQANYLEDSLVELHVRNPEMTYLTHKVTSVDGSVLNLCMQGSI